MLEPEEPVFDDEDDGIISPPSVPANIPMSALPTAEWKPFPAREVPIEIVPGLDDWGGCIVDFRAQLKKCADAPAEPEDADGFSLSRNIRNHSSAAAGADGRLAARSLLLVVVMTWYLPCP